MCVCTIKMFSRVDKRAPEVGELESSSVLETICGLLLRRYVVSRFSLMFDERRRRITAVGLISRAQQTASRDDSISAVRLHYNSHRLKRRYEGLRGPARETVVPMKRPMQIAQLIGSLTCKYDLIIAAASE